MYLFLSVSGQTKVVFLFDEQHIGATYTWTESGRESAHLLSGITHVLQQVQKNLNDVQRIIVVTGPGSFTALRVVMSVVNALIYAHPHLSVSPCTAGQVYGCIDSELDAFLLQIYPGDVFVFSGQDLAMKRIAIQDLQQVLGEKGWRNYGGEVLLDTEKILLDAGYSWIKLSTEKITLPVLQKLLTLPATRDIIIPTYGKGANITTPKG